MRIRAVTLGLDLSADILLSDPSLQFVERRIIYAKKTLDEIQQLLENAGYTVQTTRVSFNSFAEWLLPLLPVLSHVSGDSDTTCKSQESIFLDLVQKIDQMLVDIGISFCSFGCVTKPEHFFYVGQLIRGTRCISASIELSPLESSLFGNAQPRQVALVAPDFDQCMKAAEVCIDVAGVRVDSPQEQHDNFRFCVSYQAPKNIPFFPVACHESGKPPTVSIGLENGDLIFLACFAAENFVEARDNLLNTLVQAVSPIQIIVQKYCMEQGVLYGGVDASINPGLAPQDSVVQGLEHALQYIYASAEDKALLQKSINWPPSSASSTSSAASGSGKTAPSNSRIFGSMGTLSGVSAITSAVKLLGHQPLHYSDGSTSTNEKILTCGYNGLMLPVMEDITLAARAAAVTSIPPVSSPSSSSSSDPSAGPATGFSLRDLLTFSSVCGVGLDTVPIAGDVSVEALAAVYSEVGTLSYRLNKPLTCRLLPMKGLRPGDFTQLPENPYLVNTRVFSID